MAASPCNHILTKHPLWHPSGTAGHRPPHSAQVFHRGLPTRASTCSHPPLPPHPHSTVVSSYSLLSGTHRSPHCLCSAPQLQPSNFSIPCDFKELQLTLDGTAPPACRRRDSPMQLPKPPSTQQPVLCIQAELWQPGMVLGC